MTVKEVIKTNWKNLVRYHWNGGTSTELKNMIKGYREKEEKSYETWLIRKSPEFKNEVRSIYFS
jgi:hypothetical protein